jgi:hypothetical protein
MAQCTCTDAFWSEQLRDRMVDKIMRFSYFSDVPRVSMVLDQKVRG